MNDQTAIDAVAVNTQLGNISHADATSSTATPRAGFLERTVTRLLMRSARVSGAVSLSENFRLIDFQGEALKDCTWLPGDKIQVKLDGGFITRTYTPIEWDRKTGATRLIGYCHGSGPGSHWCRYATVGEERQFMGPRGSMDLRGLAPATIVFGDETSFGLALALQNNSDRSEERHFVFEVSDPQESAAVLHMLGLNAFTLIARQPHDAHLEEVSTAIRRFARSASMFVLSGRAQSIQHVSRMLKTLGVRSRHVRSKAYWAPGKTGLD